MTQRDSEKKPCDRFISLGMRMFIRGWGQGDERRKKEEEEEEKKKESVIEPKEREKIEKQNCTSLVCLAWMSRCVTS